MIDMVAARRYRSAKATGQGGPHFNPLHVITMSEKHKYPTCPGTQIKNLRGEKFGRLKVVAMAPFRHKPSGKRRVFWVCSCSCGATVEVSSNGLLNSGTKSCGCIWQEGVGTHHKTHGHAPTTGWTAEYRAYCAMRERCLNPNSKRFPDYGGRGIKICSRWIDSFENFYADMGDKPSNRHSIHRVNNDGQYEPDNCVWATRQVQANETRKNRKLTAFGRTQNLCQWAAEIGVKRSTIGYRLASGWPVEKALATHF